MKRSRLALLAIPGPSVRLLGASVSLPNCQVYGSRRRLPYLLACAVVCFLSLGSMQPALIAQEPPEPPLEADADEREPAELPEGHSQHGEAFNQGPRQAAYLMKGTGVIHFPVTTSVPEARKFVEQGVGQLHGFWYFEAERSFRQAATLDPQCAIAYWGMARANTNNGERAKKFLSEAIARKEHASVIEAMYIDALDAYYKEKDSGRRAKAFVAALEEIVKRFPNELEAKAQLGYALYKYRADAKRSREQVDTVLGEVLAAEPMHPVHHYRIHLWDGKEAAKALKSSGLCGQSAPGIAHMWHMPGHIYSRLHRYEDAVYQQEASARVDHAHMMRDRVLPDQIHNFAHNNEWLIRNLTYIGRWQDAIDLARNMTELPQHPKYNTFSKQGSAGYGRRRLFDVLYQYEQWSALVALAEGSQLPPTEIETEQIKRLRHLGVAYVYTSDEAAVDRTLAELERRLATAQAKVAEEKAKEEVEAAKDAEKKDKKKPKKKPPSAIATLAKSIEKALSLIRGHRLAAKQDFAGAVELLENADEDKLVLARIQALAGQSDEAVKAAAEAMKRQTKRVASLAAHVEILWQSGKRDEAAKAFAELRDISGSIQWGSPVFDRLAPIAQELGMPADWRYASKASDDVGDRPPLDSLGPFRWQPVVAREWTLADHEGKLHSLKDYRDRPVVVIFYLGFACLHCAEQLQAFAPQAEAFRAAGIELVAISTDDAKGLKMSVDNYDGKMPIPLVSDSALDVFKAYRVFDDFEKTPLHGTFLIDGAGKVRWQDISYEPFMDPKFLLAESKRLLAQQKVTQLAFAQTPPAPPRPEEPVTPAPLARIDPAGISGSLVIAGSELTAAALDSFFELAQGVKSRVVVLRAGESDEAAAETARLLAHWEQKRGESLQVLRLPADKKGDLSQHLEALGTATAVWLVGGEGGPTQNMLLGGELAAACRAVLDRGGVIGAADKAAMLLTPARFNGNGEEILINGANFLPDGIIDVAAAAQDSSARLPSAIRQSPGVIGYEIDHKAALVVRGRLMRVVGEGSVRVWLPQAESRPAEPLVLSPPRGAADLTALRRAARTRIGASFPPTQPKPSRVDKGTLILIGGGGMPAGMVKRFVELAGGEQASIVVLPTANPDPLAERDRMAETFKEAGAGKVTTLTGRTLEKVDSEEYTRAMAEATGIWFGGGRQWRFVDAYLGTKLHDAMHGVLDRGGVIMGSSAGASIQAEYLARGNPLGNLDIMAEGYEQGLGFLAGAAVDQHFSQRKRQKDMESLVARYPQVLGIGIDESTALIVSGKDGEVAGSGGVHFYDAKKAAGENAVAPDVVKQGGRYDLVERKVLAKGEKDEKPTEAAAADLSTGK